MRAGKIKASNEKSMQILPLVIAAGAVAVALPAAAQDIFLAAAG